jgi:type IV pilus assembly protein PilE
MRFFRQQGFTLIELMAVVAIVGILAAIAIPSYQESVRKSRRADAEGALLNFTNAMERHFTVNNSYCDAGGAGGANTCFPGIADTGVNDTGTPLGSIYAPPGQTAQYYNFIIFSATANTYQLQAIPINGQATDKCGTLITDETGTKNIADHEPGLQVTDCW